jgi:hypothetical protein
LSVPEDHAAELSGPLRRLTSGLRVSPELRPRASRIVRALVDEAQRRGHGIEPGPTGSTFSLCVGEDRFPFLLFEEDAVDKAPPRAEAKGRRVPWQRMGPRPAFQPSGRLALHLQVDYRKRTWADRSRWQLESRLGDALAEAEAFAKEAAERRESRRSEGRRRLQEWEQAVVLARTRYVEKFHRDRIEAQLMRWRDARGLREFADAVEAQATEHEGLEADALSIEWARTIRREADRVDPIAAPADLRMAIPKAPEPADLKPFMPSWMSPYGPPTDPWIDS